MNPNNNHSGNSFSQEAPNLLNNNKLTQAKKTNSNTKSYEQILEEARIPALKGLSARVVEVLQRRVGHEGLSIEEIADEIQLSKRTLQRHLRQQNMHFGAIRDLVRFNTSIDCLLKQEMSIEETASYLDFADRTSFTYAFKRWADISPSVFRKTYRDYV